MESKKYNKVCLAINFTTRWNCTTTSRPPVVPPVEPPVEPPFVVPPYYGLWI